MHGLSPLLASIIALNQPSPCSSPPADTTQVEVVECAPNQARNLIAPSGVTAGQAALFLPRLLLYPARLGTQLLFWPARQAYVQIERNHLGAKVHRLLYNDAGTAGILPAASYQSSFGWTVGLRAFHHDLFGGGERISAKVDYGGVFDETYQVKFRAEELGGRRLWI